MDKGIEIEAGDAESARRKNGCEREMRYDGNMKGEEKAKVKQTGQTKRNKARTN